MIATAFEVLFAALILCGVWHREKLIAFEDAIETMAARKAAEIVRRYNSCIRYFTSSKEISTVRGLSTDLKA